MGLLVPTFSVIISHRRVSSLEVVYTTGPAETKIELSALIYNPAKNLSSYTFGIKIDDSKSTILGF
jgi:hypothetical protein